MPAILYPWIVWHQIVSFLQGPPADGWWVRLLYQRALAGLYLVAFLNVVNQWPALVGDHGLMPARRFIERIRFRRTPSLFYLRGCANDRVFAVAAWSGVALSLLALFGVSEAFGLWPSLLTWTALFVLYLSFVNVGQTFYGFGWESILLEAGFFAIFLGPSRMAPPMVVLWMIRWLLFRVMFGAGLIKLRGDPCWRKMTALCFHYETQPLPNPLSRWFHGLPRPVQKLSGAFTLFVELPVCFFYFAPQPWAAVAGALTIAFQMVLILSGNLSWLNWLTILITIPCFTGFGTAPQVSPIPDAWAVVLLLLTATVVVMSWWPVRNMLSRHQLMNASFNPLHLVGTYGAFGSVDRERYEVIVEGSHDGDDWRAYEFKCKPGDPRRRPGVVSPYHLRLDWLMWFVAKADAWQHPWFMVFLGKLLLADRATLRLMRSSPFGDEAPRYVRARLFRYRFGHGDCYWDREEVDELFVPPVALRKDVQQHHQEHQQHG